MLTAPLKQGLYAVLAADTTVAGLVTKNSFINVYPTVLPADIFPTNFPAITYQIISTDRIHRLEDGASSAAQARIQISSWAQTAKQAQDVADAVRNLLDGMTRNPDGSPKVVTWTSPDGSVAVDSVLLMDCRDEFEEYQRLHRVDLDFQVYLHDA